MPDDVRYNARLREMRALTVRQLMEHLANELRCFVALCQMADHSRREERVKPFAAVASDCACGMRCANDMLARRVVGFDDTPECLELGAAVDDAMQAIDVLVQQREGPLAGERATQLSALLRSQAGRLIAAYQLADGWFHGRSDDRRPATDPCASQSPAGRSRGLVESVGRHQRGRPRNVRGTSPGGGVTCRCSAEKQRICPQCIELTD